MTAFARSALDGFQLATAAAVDRSRSRGAKIRLSMLGSFGPKSSCRAGTTIRQPGSGAHGG